jgi:hypothetical protein
MGSAPLPRGWKNHIKSSLLHAISLATAALTVVISYVEGRRHLPVVELREAARFQVQD